MSRSKNPSHLYQQSTSSVWSIRLEPPKELKQLDPKAKAYRKSLGTRDVKKAQQLAGQLIPSIRKNWELRIQQLQSIRTLPVLTDIPILSQPVPRALDSTLISQLLATRTQSWAYTDNYERSEGCSDDEISEQQSFAEQSISAFSQVALKGAKASTWISCVEEALDWADNCGYAIDSTDPQLNAYVLAFSKNELRLQQRILKIIKGDEVELVDNYIPPDIFQAPPEKEENYTWEKAINDYQSYQKNTLKNKTLGTELNTINSLKEYLKSKDIESITSKDIFDFFKFKLDNDNWSNDRVNRHGKNTLKKFFSHCITQNSLKINPIENLQTLPKISREEEKLHERPNKPFTDEQVSEIFSSEWYKNKKLFRGSLSKDSGARYWIPLIMLFHGFRVTEACQLHKENIKIYEGIPCFNTILTDEIELNKEFIKYKEAFSLKTSSTGRLIPIHPILLELGFMDFIKHNKNKFFLFSSCIPEENSNSPKFGRAFEQAFLRFIRFSLEMDKGFGNHSFRHLIEDKIRIANKLSQPWPPGVSQQYMGRSFNSVDKERIVFKSQGSSAYYGYGYPPENILECIKTLDFSKINLPPCYNDWLKNMS